MIVILQAKNHRKIIYFIMKCTKQSDALTVNCDIDRSVACAEGIYNFSCVLS